MLADRLRKLGSLSALTHAFMIDDGISKAYQQIGGAEHVDNKVAGLDILFSLPSLP